MRFFGPKEGSPPRGLPGFFKNFQRGVLLMPIRRRGQQIADRPDGRALFTDHLPDLGLRQLQQEMDGPAAFFLPENHLVGPVDQRFDHKPQEFVHGRLERERLCRR